MELPKVEEKGWKRRRRISTLQAAKCCSGNSATGTTLTQWFPALLSYFPRDLPPGSFYSGSFPEVSPCSEPQRPAPHLRAKPDKNLLFLLFTSKIQRGQERVRAAGLLLILRCSSRWGRRVFQRAEPAPAPAALRNFLAESKRGRSCCEAPPSLQSWGLWCVWAPWVGAGDIHDKFCEKRRRALAVPEPRHLWEPDQEVIQCSVPARGPLLWVSVVVNPSAQGRLTLSMSAASSVVWEPLCHGDVSAGCGWESCCSWVSFERDLLFSEFLCSQHRAKKPLFFLWMLKSSYSSW